MRPDGDLYTEQTSNEGEWAEVCEAFATAVYRRLWGQTEASRADARGVGPAPDLSPAKGVIERYKRCPEFRRATIATSIVVGGAWAAQ